MKVFSATTFATLLYTLSFLDSAAAVPADTHAVAKVGDKPDVEVALNKRELVERAPQVTTTPRTRADWRTRVVTTTTTPRTRADWRTRVTGTSSSSTLNFIPAPVSSSTTSSPAAGGGFVPAPQPTTTTTSVAPGVTTTPVPIAADNSAVASFSDPAAPTTTTTTTTSAAPSSTVGANIRDAVVNEHAKFRALHGAAPLTWDQTLADAAQSWASRCIWGHSLGAVGNYGENLASTAGQRGITTDQLVVGLIGLWEAEDVDYTPATPNYSHFTQMVWKSTTKIGCVLQTCPPGTIFDAKYGDASFLVCEYDPRGNVYPDENFRANVQP
ncbi:hypothetical protein JCM6882_003434 [Rhodosporidiobolus microsporus]